MSDGEKEKIEALEREVRLLRDEVSDLESELETAKELEIEVVGGLPRVIHDTMRELGGDFGAEDVPWRATTTAHQMRISEAIRRAGHETQS